ncbi:MAG: acyl-CoA synthetase [Alphaproteobacteria bacterium]|nr:acyl-CoA synthetase [Alphaproteobacteria bacterium]
MFTPQKKIINLSDVHSLEAKPLDETIPFQNIYHALAAAAEDNPDHPALSYISDLAPDRELTTWSRGEMMGKITQAANLFHDLGLGPTDVIAFLLPALPETHVVLWGAETTAIAAPINYLLTAETIAELLEASEAKALVALGPHPAFDIWQKALDVKKMVPEVQHLFQVNADGHSPDKSVPVFMDEITSQPSDKLLTKRDFNKKDIAALFHTGGTTGTPKLAQHDHQGQLFTAWSAVQMNHVETSNKILGIFPLFHVAGALVGGLGVLTGGAHIIIPTALGPRNPEVITNFWKIIERFKLTSLSGVPTILTALTNRPVDADISSLQSVRTGAAPLASETAKAFEAMTGLKIHESLGMTETSGILSITPRYGERIPGSVGFPIPYSRVSIRQFNGEDLPPGKECEVEETGMVLFRGPNVFPGYTDPSRNKNVFTEDGWLITGDLGKLSIEGVLTLTGRAKDVIIRGGHNIDPLVIETISDKHPAVRSSVAVGQPDRYAGEVPVLFVMLKEGAKATEVELMNFLSKNIDEPPARPRWIRILDQLPVTGVGKVFKPKLRAIAVEDACKEALSSLTEEGLNFVVSAENTPSSGIIVSVNFTKITDSKDQTKFTDKINQLLGGFSLTTEVNFG